MIRKKVLQKGKIPSVKQSWDIILQASDMSNDVSMATERGFRVVMLDECLVTKNTLPTHAWSNKLVNAKIDKSWIKEPSKAILLAVSQEMGLDHLEIHNNSINKRKFKSFLDHLRAKFPFDNMVLVMDNLSIHKSREVRERMDELGFLYAWTPVYSP